MRLSCKVNDAEQLQDFLDDEIDNKKEFILNTSQDEIEYKSDCMDDVDIKNGQYTIEDTIDAATDVTTVKMEGRKGSVQKSLYDKKC